MRGATVVECLSCVYFPSPSPLQYKVWIKPAAEQSFLYGNHILKNGIARMTESTPQYEGVVIFSSSDIPLVRRSWAQCDVMTGNVALCCVWELLLWALAE